jgi:hypothetical protein
MVQGLVVFACILVSSLCYAYEENCMPDLAVPTGIEAKSMEVIITHRFYRIPGADFPDNFINYANVKLGLRYVVIPKLEIGTTYQFFRKEYTFHSAYSLFMPKQFLRAQALLQFFGAKNDLNQTWDHNLLYQINLQSEPLGRRFLPALDFAYNGLNKKAGMGTGIGVALKSNVDFLAEYYPVIGKKDLSSGGSENVNCFLVGVKLTTYGHHFMFSVANNYETGMRRLMAGTADNTLYYGFNIHRLFSF